MKVILLILTFFINFAYAYSSTASNKTNPPIVVDKVDSQARDLKEMHDKNTGESVISTVQSTLQLMEMMYGTKIHSQNRGELSTDTLMVDGHTEASMDAFNRELQQELSAAAINNSAVGVSNSADQLKCYIARDIPFQYTCTKTGLTYGGEVGVSGKQALNTCKDECYTQDKCYNDVSGDTEEQEKILTEANSVKWDFSDPNLTYKLKYNTTTERKVKNFKINLYFTDKDGNTLKSKEKTVYYNVYATEKGETSEKLVLYKALFRSGSDVQNVYFNRYITNIRLEVYNMDETGFNVSPKISLDYSTKGRWFCPKFQDITDLVGTKFNKKCPSGTLTFVSDGENHSSTICSNGLKSGDNVDGTFSERTKCESICRTSYACVGAQMVTSTKQLESYNEGCLGGQGNCKNSDCKAARITQAPVVSEIVFDADMNPTITVSNGTQVPGTKRPRLTQEEVLDFEARNIEEWKDKAYEDMVENNRYVETKVAIGKNTEREFAFAIGVGNYGQNQLVWNIKPAAFDVNNNKNFYMYAVLEIEFEYWGYDQDGKAKAYRDKVYYLKTGENTNYKPFVRYIDYGVVDINDKGLPVLSKNEYSTPKFQTFSGTSWVTLSSSTKAPYFKVEDFKDPKFFYRQVIIDDLGNYNYYLPGMVRSSYVSGISVVKKYNGEFDGTGDNVARTAVHVYYTDKKLSYLDIFNKIQEEEDNDNSQNSTNFVKIYDTSFDAKSINTLVADSIDHEKEYIKIYRYGPVDKTSAFFTIKPLPPFVGQKGFIYVLLY